MGVDTSIPAPRVLITTSTRHELNGAISRLGAAPITLAERPGPLDPPSALGPYPDLAAGISSVAIDSESRLLETLLDSGICDGALRNPADWAYEGLAISRESNTANIGRACGASKHLLARLALGTPSMFSLTKSLRTARAVRAETVRLISNAF